MEKDKNWEAKYLVLREIIRDIDFTIKVADNHQGVVLTELAGEYSGIPPKTYAYDDLDVFVSDLKEMIQNRKNKEG